MAGYSSWIAGNSVLAQEPHQFSRSWVDGSSATFHIDEGTPDSWFQFSIPTPTRIASKVGVLERVMLLFRTEDPNTAGIDRVDLWDGPKLIQTNSVTWGGDHSASIQLVREKDGSFGGNILPVSDGYQMNWGLNVSLQVFSGFGGELTFVSIGADFSADT